MSDLRLEHRLLREQALQIAEGIAATFAPFCEVAVHDLLAPGEAIIALHNNLSGRELGGPSTELGLARGADPDFPQIVANYPNRFADGRPVKSTSIGIKDSRGEYVASICLNIDLTLFSGVRSILDAFTAVERDVVAESLDPAGADAIRARIDRFAAERSTTPRSLSTIQRRELLSELRSTGVMDVRRSAVTAAQHLGVSRATIYADARR